MRTTRSAGVPFILVVLFLDTLGLGVIIPVLPRLLASFLRGDLTEASRYYGWFVAVYAAMQLFFAPVVGALSDRFGRRPVILMSLLGAGLDYLLLAFAPSIAWLFVGRVLAGITGASYAAATAYIADVTTPADRAKSFGLAGAAFGLGFIAGPAVGGAVGGLSLRAPFVVAAVLNLINVVYGVFVLPESLAHEHRRAFSAARANPLGALRNLGKSRLLLGLTGTLASAYLGQHILQSVWAVYTQARFGWSPWDIGVSLAAVGISGAIVQGGLVRAIVPRLGERRALLAGLVCGVLGFTAFGLATRGWMIYALILPFSIGGIAGPATQALLTREVSASAQGELQGSLAILNSIAAIVGPIFGTSLFAAFPPAVAAPFFAAALLNAIGLAFALRVFARVPAEASPR